MIGILDMDMGNLRSISNAVYNVGHDFVIIREKKQMDDISNLILPGVGSFSAAMRHLDEMDIREGLLDFAGSRRPVLGLCIGMQLLGLSGDEGGETDGLGLVPGRVKRLPVDDSLPLPHIGWNSVEYNKKHPVFEKVKSGVDFYFVHSFSCEQGEYVIGETEYGCRFPSIIGRDNILGFQFHPEKSQVNGLQLIENFCNWNGKW